MHKCKRNPAQGAFLFFAHFCFRLDLVLKPAGLVNNGGIKRIEELRVEAELLARGNARIAHFLHAVMQKGRQAVFRLDLRHLGHDAKTPRQQLQNPRIDIVDLLAIGLEKLRRAFLIVFFHGFSHRRDVDVEVARDFVKPAVAALPDGLELPAHADAVYFSEDIGIVARRAVRKSEPRQLLLRIEVDDADVGVFDKPEILLPLLRIVYGHGENDLLDIEVQRL